MAETVVTKKCDNHSGVCEAVNNLKSQNIMLWEAVKGINNKLWTILFLAAAGAVGTLINLLITHNGMK